MRILRFTLLLFAAIAFAGLGCSDDDGDDTGTGPTTPSLTDATVNLTAMDPHVGQLVELRVVSDNDELQSRVILDPLRAASETVVLNRALPDGTFRLDFFADLSMDGTYDAPPTDHAWRLNLPDNGTINFTHNTTFTDISSPAVTEPGGTFMLDLTGFTPHLNQLFEVRVIENSSGKTVGLYRLESIPAADFTVSIDGIAQSGVAYRVDFYADLNQDGSYDAPPTDHAWRLTGTADAGGLSLSFPHGTNFTDISVPPGGSGGGDGGGDGGGGGPY